MKAKPETERKPDLTRRWHGSELMDNPECDETDLRRTLDQFAPLNRFVSRYRRILSKWVLDDMAAADRHRAWRLADLGAGGCDIAVWLLRAARRRGLKLRVTAVDRDPRVIAYAHSRRGCEPGLRIRQADIRDIRALGRFDYLFANHVLHHLPDESIPPMLASMQAAAGRRWVVSDLLRSRWAYAAFRMLSIVHRRGFAAEDGLRSIRRGFMPAELQAYLHAAGLAQSVLLRRYRPARVCLVGLGAHEQSAVMHAARQAGR